MEPGSIEPISGSPVVAARPFLMRRGDIKVAMIASMELVGIVRVILIVLVVDARKAWEEGGIRICWIKKCGKARGHIDDHIGAIGAEWESKEG